MNIPTDPALPPPDLDGVRLGVRVVALHIAVLGEEPGRYQFQQDAGEDAQGADADLN